MNSKIYPLIKIAVPLVLKEKGLSYELGELEVKENPWGGYLRVFLSDPQTQIKVPGVWTPSDEKANDTESSQIAFALSMSKNLIDSLTDVIAQSQSLPPYDKSPHGNWVKV